MSIACESGSAAATARSVSGIWSTGKNTPESRSIGVSTSVKKYVKKSYPGASEFMTRPNAPNVSPTTKPSGSTQMASQEWPKPSTMTTARIASTDITLFDAAHIHSANTTSSSEMGALMIASHVRCTCMRENAEYIASKDDVNIALWQTMPVQINAMYFIPPTSGTNAPMP